jgi:hypothetical protein
MRREQEHERCGLPPEENPGRMGFRFIFLNAQSLA